MTTPWYKFLSLYYLKRKESQSQWASQDSDAGMQYLCEYDIEPEIYLAKKAIGGGIEVREEWGIFLGGEVLNGQI